MPLCPDEADAEIAQKARFAETFVNRPLEDDVKWYESRRGQRSPWVRRVPYRSEAERQVMEVLDADPSVVAWGYEVHAVHQDWNRVPRKGAKPRPDFFWWPDFYVITTGPKDLVLEVKGLPYLPDYALLVFPSIREAVEECGDAFHLFFPRAGARYCPRSHVNLPDREIFTEAARSADHLASSCTGAARQKRLEDAEQLRKYAKTPPITGMTYR